MSIKKRSFTPEFPWFDDWDSLRLRLSEANTLYFHITGHRSPKTGDRQKSMRLEMAGFAQFDRRKNLRDLRPSKELSAIFPDPIDSLQNYWPESPMAEGRGAISAVRAGHLSAYRQSLLNLWLISVLHLELADLPGGISETRRENFHLSQMKLKRCACRAISVKIDCTTIWGVTWWTVKDSSLETHSRP
jgi:hypothetical protein